MKSVSYLLCLDYLGDEEGGEPCIKQVYFRQFLPVSPKVNLDFIIIFTVINYSSSCPVIL